MGRGPQAILALSLLTLPAVARANGLSTHVWITLNAREHTVPGLRELVLHPENEAALISGTIFPDGGYAVGHAYGELAHWEPLQLAYLEWIRAHYTPPYTGEGAKHVAFLLGMLSHGMADQIFDSLYLARAKIYDASSDWAMKSVDEATDVAWCYEVGAQPVVEHFLPTEVFIELLGAQNPVEAATLERGENLAGFAIAIVGMLSRDPQAVLDYQKQFPWATKHLSDVGVPGRPEEEAVFVAKYWEKAWALLHGEPFDDLVLGTVPRDGARGHARDPSSIESQISIVFAERQNDASVVPERFKVVGAAGAEVAVGVDLFYGTDSHVVHLSPKTELAKDEDYTVTVDGEYSFSFSTKEVMAGEDQTSCGCSAGVRGTSPAGYLLVLILIVSRSGSRRR